MSLRETYLPELPAHCEACHYKPRIYSSYRGPYFVFEVHHIVPRLKGGRDDRDNLVMLCRNCHEIAECLGAEDPIPTQREDFLDDFRAALRDPNAFVQKCQQRRDDLREFGFFWSRGRQFTSDGRRVKPSVPRATWITGPGQAAHPADRAESGPPWRGHPADHPVLGQPWLVQR